MEGKRDEQGRPLPGRTPGLPSRLGDGALVTTFLLALLVLVMLGITGLLMLTLAHALSSPDPATVVELHWSAVRTLGWKLFAALLRAAARYLGMWHPSPAVVPGEAIYSPTKGGAWAGRQLVKVLTRMADENAVRLFWPGLRTRLRAEAEVCRSCLEGKYEPLHGGSRGAAT